MVSPAGTISSEKTNKLLGLEIVRFVSALAVLVWHYQHFAYVADSPVNFARDSQPFYPFLSLFYNYGYLGVQVFWCISGFIFFWKYKESLANGAVSAKTFFILRFSRLYPLHFVTLITVLLLQYAYFSERGFYFIYQFDDLRHFFLQLFLASNWGFELGDSFNGPIWSISVETLVYVIFFLLLRYVGTSFWINIVNIAGSLATKFFNIHMPIFDCLIFFYAGGLSAIALQYFSQTRFKTALKIVAFAMLFAMPVASILLPISHNKFFPVLFMLAYIPTLLYVGARNIHVPSDVQKLIVVAGNMTYASYLIHFPIQLALTLYFIKTGQDIPYTNPLFFINFICIILIASYYVYRFFERPAQDAIRGLALPAKPSMSMAAAETR